MIRGFVKTKCPECGHVFLAPDIEDNATVFSVPVKCPKCGAMIRIGVGSGPKPKNLLRRLLTILERLSHESS